MKVRKFWAKGYRSLRDVTLDGLGEFNVFYGPNGSGKSNLLDAIQTFFCVMPLAVDASYGGDDRLSFLEAGRLAERQGWIDLDDYDKRADEAKIVLGAALDLEVGRVELELNLWRLRSGQRLRISRLLVDGQPPGLPFSVPELHALLGNIVPQAFTHLGITRTLSVNAPRDAASPHVVGTIPDGDVVRELFEAKNSNDPALRQRFDELREFMAKTLQREECNVYLDTKSGRLELRERLPAPNPFGRDIPVDNAGHGVVQMYAIVAPILLAQGRLVAIEEPEAHLHAPTLGRQLRVILHDMVTSGRVDQLFIATHSNLFDLDLTGYWDVSLRDGATCVQRKPLDEVDRLHLFEPGPAKHQLQELLRLHGDEVVFRTSEGRELRAQEMLAALQNDEDVAKAFLESLHGAAMQVTGLRAKRGRGAAPPERPRTAISRARCPGSTSS